MQRTVSFDQDFGHFGTGEFPGRGFARPEHRADLGSGIEDMVLRLMWACFEGGHVFASPAIERHFEEYRDNSDFVGFETGKYPLSVVWAVIISHTRMVPSHNEMGASVIFPAQRMEDSFPRAGILREFREDADHAVFRGIVMREDRLVGLHADCRRNIVRFRIVDDGLKDEAVHFFKCAFLDVFVGMVQRIPCLESDHAVPSPFLEFPSRIGGFKPIGEKPFSGRKVQDLQTASQAEVPFAHQGLYARMGGIVCAIDGPGRR